MFISLSIENFRSIKEKCSISFLSSNSSKDHLNGHIYHSSEGNFSILRSAGIYGANASGKSNILLAFEAIRYLVVGSKSLDEGEKIPCYEPYALSHQTTNKPTVFEADFLLEDDIRYTYKVSYNEKEILEESLDFYPNKVKSNIFSRQENDNFESVKFGSNYKGGARRIAFFPNNTYLSKAGSNAAAPKMIRDVYTFFRSNCMHLSTRERLSLDINDNTNDIISKISEILCYIDTGITSIKIKEKDDIKMPEFLKSFDEKIQQDFIKRNKSKFIFSHIDENGLEVEFEEKLESDGTRKIFSMMGPLMAAFSHRHVFVFDEIDNGLHPHIADVLIRLFNDKTINKVGSQLIFSTHNLQIMNPEKMRRDQIWFTEKNNGKTVIYSLDDFDKKQVKTTTPYASWYNDGRFGGVPNINFTKIKELILNVNKDKDSDIDESVFGSFDE